MEPSAESRAEQPAPFPLTDLDRSLLKQTDEEYKPHDWEDLKQIIATDDLSVLKRKPSQLRLYIEWTRDIKSTFGFVVHYVCSERLHWAPKGGQIAVAPKNPIPFADATDYKIVLNDWPYGCTPDITHLVVWLKTRFDVDSEGRLLPAAMASIESFVDETFRQPLAVRGCSTDRVLWFKNWTVLQSVRALEHFHVMVRNADKKILKLWTEDDIGISPSTGGS